jgi:hypothetical protein
VNLHTRKCLDTCILEKKSKTSYILERRKYILIRIMVFYSVPSYQFGLILELKIQWYGLYWFFKMRSSQLSHANLANMNIKMDKNPLRDVT